MKIIVNSSIFNAFASRLVSTSALYNSLAVQKSLAKESPTTEDILHKIPFFHNIKEQVTKIATVTKTEDEVIVEVNDNYIIGSINLAFNLYDRVADTAVTMIKEISIWEKESKAFEAEWSESPKFDTSAAWSKVCEEVNSDKPNPIPTVHSVTYGDVTVEVSEPENVHNIYAKDVDKQVQVTSLVCIREGEEIPYILSRAMVKCICQSEFDPNYFVGGSFDLPLDVINAVRSYYGLPLFWDEKQIKEYQAKKAQDNQQPE